jgi:hypothetical protein
MSSHDCSLAPMPATSQGSRPGLAATGRMNLARKEARNAWMGLVNNTLEAFGISTATAAERASMPRTALQEAREGHRGLQVCQLSAFGREVELAVLEARIRQLRGMSRAPRIPIHMHAIRCSAKVGAVAETVAEALADGKVDEREQVKLRRCIHSAVQEFRGFDLDVTEGGA